MDEETLSMINKLAEDMETTRAEIVRALLGYALGNVNEVFGGEEETIENLEEDEIEDEENGE